MNPNVLARGRAAAEALMTDTCLIERQQVDAGGRPVFTVDPDTGESTPAMDEVYSGKCRFQSRGDWSTERDIGEAGLVLLQTELQLPISVDPAINDRVTAVTSAFNPVLAGRVFEVRGDFLKSHNTSRKVMLNQVTG